MGVSVGDEGMGTRGNAAEWERLHELLSRSSSSSSCLPAGRARMRNQGQVGKRAENSAI